MGTVVRLTTLLALMGLFVALLLGAAPSTAGAAVQPAQVAPDGAVCGLYSQWTHTYLTGTQANYLGSGLTGYHWLRIQCSAGAVYIHDWWTLG